MNTLINYIFSLYQISTTEEPGLGLKTYVFTILSSKTRDYYMWHIIEYYELFMEIKHKHLNMRKTRKNSTDKNANTEIS